MYWSAQKLQAVLPGLESSSPASPLLGSPTGVAATFPENKRPKESNAKRNGSVLEQTAPARPLGHAGEGSPCPNFYSPLAFAVTALSRTHVEDLTLPLPGRFWDGYGAAGRLRLPPVLPRRAPPPGRQHRRGQRSCSRRSAPAAPTGRSPGGHPQPGGESHRGNPKRHASEPRRATSSPTPSSPQGQAA